VPRKLTRLILRIDELAIDGDIEDAAIAFDQLRGLPRMSANRFRQTGGLRLVVSLHAVRDRNRHR
jgi:hypothetical protein